MLKLLVILYIIKLYSEITFLNEFNRTMDKISLVQLEHLSNEKVYETQVDITFIKKCKIESWIPTFSKVNLSIKAYGCKLKIYCKDRYGKWNAIETLQKEEITRRYLIFICTSEDIVSFNYVWIKITTFFKWRVSIILWSFSS